MQRRVGGSLGLALLSLVPLVAATAPPAAAAPCRSLIRPGSWSGQMTQQFTVDGTATSGMYVKEVGTTRATLAVKVACNGKLQGVLRDLSFDLRGTFSIASTSIPIECRGTTEERSVTGTVTKGSPRKPVIDLVYGPSVAETFSCAGGPFADALNAAFAGQRDAPPDAPTGLRLTADRATRAALSGTRLEATGGFDPIAISTQALQVLGLSPVIEQAWQLTRT